MNHVRARARQIERAMMRGPRRTDRVAGVAIAAPHVAAAHDHKCLHCGYHVCGCLRKQAAKPAEPRVRRFDWRNDRGEALVCEASGLEAWVGRSYGAYIFAGVSGTPGERKTADALWHLGLSECDGPQTERLALCEAQLNRLLDEREGKEPAAEPKPEQLAPGWRPNDKLWTGPERAFHHVSGVGVWNPGGTKWNWTAPGGNLAIGVAPTRDEAMARSLGWAPDADAFWRCEDPGCLCLVREHGSRDGSWVALHRCGASRDGFPSLPHAIAWARGDA